MRPTGGKLWRFKYRYQGKEQQLSLGSYPEVSLKEAHERRDVARKGIAEVKDPGAGKKREKIAAAISAGNTFKVVAEEFISKRQREGSFDSRIGSALRGECLHLNLLKPKASTNLIDNHNFNELV